MRKSIRKIVSLCLAMAMLLPVLAMPAFAEQRAVHIHNYNIELSYHEEYEDLNGNMHYCHVTKLMACDCGVSTVVMDTYTRPHVFVQADPDISGGNTEEDTDIYYVCKFCGHSYHT